MGSIGEDWWMKNVEKIAKSRTSRAKTSTCTGTGQAVPVHLVQKWAVGNLYRYMCEQPIPV